VRASIAELFQAPGTTHASPQVRGFF
jgi:hypothetical protein